MHKRTSVNAVPPVEAFIKEGDPHKTRVVSPGRFLGIRRATEDLCHPLAVDDYGVQGADFVSPPKWHLAHTTWFFENFVLRRHKKDYVSSLPITDHLFNSYYLGVSDPYDRPKRGVLSRPTVADIMGYRRFVEERVLHLLEEGEAIHEEASLIPIVELGLHHEQQHQELLMMDILYNFSLNPVYPAYCAKEATLPLEIMLLAPCIARGWIHFNGGLAMIGSTEEGFSFDNERPAHRVWLDPYALAAGLVTNAEYLQFMEDGGYRNNALWLADGWTCVENNHWHAPLYWKKIDDEWWQMTLHGMRKVVPTEPVSHVSFYEADAFARWHGSRLPTEAEWENAALTSSTAAGVSTSEDATSASVKSQHSLSQMYESLWQWTGSAYRPYPGFKAEGGPLGEYNGKFMCNQFVLRGGSFASPRGHLRASYRNYFYPDMRWQFSGIRLARSL